MTLGLIPASELKPEQVEWLWPGRIPLGTITILDGSPGLGKSLITYDLAARVTAGRPVPGCADATDPAAAILLQAEDHPQTVVVPSLKAAGADLSKVYLCNRWQETGRTLQIPDNINIDVIESKVAEAGAKLLVVDPISGYLQGNLHNDQSVRKGLLPLLALAEKHNVAVLIVRHLRKSGGRDPLHLGAGSIAFVALARSSLLIGDDPGSNNRHQHVLALNKSNLASAPSLLYRTVCRDNGAITIEWLGETPITAKDLTVATGSASEPSALQEAKYVLYSLLSDGPLPSREVKRRAVGEGVATRTLHRAKRAMGVKSVKRGSGKGSHWYWRLPDDDRTYRAFKQHDLDRLMKQLCYGDHELEIPDSRGQQNPRPNDGDEGQLV